MRNSLLLISTQSTDIAFAKAVSTIANLELKQVSNAIEGADYILGDEAAVIFVDVSDEKLYKALEDAIQSKIGLLSNRINANAIHFISSEDLSKVKYLIQSPFFGHYILRPTEYPTDAGEHYGRVVKATLADRSFGLKNLLKDGSKIQVIHLNSTSLKFSAVEAIKTYLLAAKYQSRMAAVIANAVDELLMNAMFDAPVDALGRPTLISTPRSTVIALAEKSAVEMHVGFDGEYVAISAIDNFGSLDKVKLLAHISKIYDKEEYKIRNAVAGAGIGLATVFRSGGSFFFVSEQTIRTEVTVFFKRTDNFRAFKDQFRFISTQFYF